MSTAPSPHAPVAPPAAPAWTDAQLAAYSRDRIAKGSKSFATAARLFAPYERASATMLYAWCRHCDDEIDGQDLGFNTPNAPHAATDERLATLQRKTQDAIDGHAIEPMFIALQRVIERHAIPARIPLDLIEGMAMDVRGYQPKTLDDTLLYAYHVAGCVGVMMAYIMGVKDRATLDRACDLGIAFQLTNIARDVRTDATVGRTYMPQDWLREAGIPQGALAVPRQTDAVHAVTLRLLDEADKYYASAYYGIAQLPFRSALAIATARRVYRDIGGVVRENGADAATRARVTPLRKLQGILAATGDTLAAHRWGLGGRPIAAAPARTGLWTMHR